MPALKLNLRSVAVLMGVVGMMVNSGVAYADGRGGHGSESPVTQGNNDPTTGNISATAGVQYNKVDNGKGTGAGLLTPVGAWTPPACWYQPMYTPAQLKTSSEEVWKQPSVGYMWVNQQRDYYVNGHPYTDFNAAKAGKGYWWAGYTDPSRYADSAAFACTASPF